MVDKIVRPLVFDFLLEKTRAVRWALRLLRNPRAQDRGSRAQDSGGAAAPRGQNRRARARCGGGGSALARATLCGG